MGTDQVGTDQVELDGAPGGAPGTPFRRAGALTGLLLTLGVSVPTLAVAEDWHGRPLIDQGGLGWLVPAVVVALAFVGGGALAGRQGSGPWRSLAEGLWVGVPAVVVLLAADAVRRLIFNPTLPDGVLAYWAEAAAAALFFSVLGAVAAGRWRGHRRCAQRGGGPHGAPHPAASREQAKLRAGGR